MQEVIPPKSPFMKEKQTMGQVVHITRPFKAHRSFSLDGIRKEVPEQISGLCVPAVVSMIIDSLIT